MSETDYWTEHDDREVARILAAHPDRQLWLLTGMVVLVVLAITLLVLGLALVGAAS